MGFRHERKNRGFTLAELLMAMAILGVIAALTVPKVIASQRSTAWNAQAKEAALALAAAYSVYQNENGQSTNTYSNSILPYLNYVKLITTGSIDHVQGMGSFGCDAAGPCYLLHNGSVVRAGGTYFGGSSDTNFVHFLFDPDGKYSGNTTGPGKSIAIDLYFGGRVNTGVERGPTDATWNGAPQVWGPDATPTWYTGWS